MGERKVLNKYYPPDFDPATIPRRKQPKNAQMKVRMMLPMSIRCSTCGNYIYKGKKFNSKKEDAVGEAYLGIQIFRFYFKCTRCSAELVMKTDPQNSDYTMEAGATRNFEPWRAKDEAEDVARREREAEEMGNAMKSLENRTAESKREMDIMAALDEMRTMRARQAGVGTDAMLAALQRTAAPAAPRSDAELDAEDEALLRSVVFQSPLAGGLVRRYTKAGNAAAAANGGAVDDGVSIDYDEDDEEESTFPEADAAEKSGAAQDGELRAAVADGGPEALQEPPQSAKEGVAAAEADSGKRERASEPGQQPAKKRDAGFVLRALPVTFAVKVKASGGGPPSSQVVKAPPAAGAAAGAVNGAATAAAQGPGGLASLVSSYDSSDNSD
eukprot:SM000137S00467  [mRNA]  locus=s137:265396:266909:- [translate_table: standard]